MFKNHMLVLRLKKDLPEDGLVDATPSITKEEILHISKKVIRHVVGGVVFVLATAAVLDTSKYAIMTGIENRSNKEED